MISITEAISIIKHQLKTAKSEEIDLRGAVGRVLAQKVEADMDLPPFNRSQMDGFAVRFKDIEKAAKETPVRLKIIGESIAGRGFDGHVKLGEAVRIMTGARVPRGADSVQKKELTDERAEGFVEILAPTSKAQNIVFKAAEIRNGERVFRKGEIINERMIAVLASFGFSRVKVYQRPTVTIIATGSEIVEIWDKPGKDQIRNSNSASLEALCRRAGAAALVLPLIPDDLESIKSRIEVITGSPKGKKAKSGAPKIIILSGGVSVGDYDFTKPALRELGAEIFFERIALRPGKPLVFAKYNGCYIFGLPGNPVSAAVTFYLFVRLLIRLIQRANETELPEASALLTRKLKGAKGRDSLLPGSFIYNDNATIAVEPSKWGGSSDFISFSEANCLIFVPRDTVIEANETARIVFLPQ